MKWLTLQRIKQQLRIEQDFHDEDELLEMYGESAEDIVLNAIRRTFNNVVLIYDGIPKNLYHAALLIVAQSYQHREPVSPTTMSLVPYSFDILLKPYMRLAGEEATDDTDLPEGLLFDADGLALMDWNIKFLTATVAA